MLVKTRRLDHDGVRVIAQGDIHDIRVLTSTGPIDLPPSSSLETDLSET